MEKTKLTKDQIAARSSERKRIEEGAKIFRTSFNSLGNIADYIINQVCTSEDEKERSYYKDVASVLTFGKPEKIEDEKAVSNYDGEKLLSIISKGTAKEMKAVKLQARKNYMAAIRKFWPYISEDGKLLEGKRVGTFVGTEGKTFAVFQAVPVSVWTFEKAFSFPVVSSNSGLLQAVKGEKYYKSESLKDSYPKEEEGYIFAGMQSYKTMMREVKESTKKAKEEGIKGLQSVKDTSSTEVKKEGE